MGWRQRYLTRDDEVITELASSVVGPEDRLVTVAAATEYKVLELVEESGQPGFSDAIAALNKLLDGGTIIFTVTERSLALGHRRKGTSGSPEHVLTVDRDALRVVELGSGRLTTYLPLQAGPLVLQAFTNRWIPKRTRHTDLGAVATALGWRGSR